MEKRENKNTPAADHHEVLGMLAKKMMLIAAAYTLPPMRNGDRRDGDHIIESSAP